VTDEHPTASELERYVIGAHESADALRLETHVARCATCATALAREARIELKLQEVARVPVLPIEDPRRGRRVAVLGGIAVLACSAALVLFGSWRAAPQEQPDEARPFIATHSPHRNVEDARTEPEPERAPRSPSGIACIEPAYVKQCMRDAHRRGLAVIEPTIQVPRYEYAAADQLN